MPTIHQAALAMPEMSAADFASLKADIQKHGLLSDIELLRGKIIDGRHRYRACQELGVDPSYVDVTLNGQTPEQYVWSVNAERRHLTPSQRAAVGVALWPPAKEKAKKRRTGRPKKNSPPKSPGKISQTSGRASDDVGQHVGVSGRYVEEAAKIQDNNPALFDEVKEGKKTLQQAKRESNPPRPKREERYPASKAVMKLLTDLVALSNMVKEEYGHDFSKLIEDEEFDPDQRMPAVQLVDALRSRLDEWKNQCNTIYKTITAKSSTNTAKNKAKRRRRKT